MLFIKGKIITKLLSPQKYKYCFNLLQKSLIVLFFSMNVGIMFVAGFPDQSVLGEKFLKAVARYQALSMLYQPWSMFAPNPMNTNSYVEAEIHFDDGSTDQTPLFRQSLLSSHKKILSGSRYRIFVQEALRPNRNDSVWFDFSKYILNQLNHTEQQNKKRKVKQIVFKRYTNKVIAPPEGPFIPHGRPTTSYESESVYSYTPTEGKVRYEAKNNI